MEANLGTTTEIQGLSGKYLAGGAGDETTVTSLATHVQALNNNVDATIGDLSELDDLSFFATSTQGEGDSITDYLTNLNGNLEAAMEQRDQAAAATQAANNAEFARLDSKINKLETKMEKGLAANNALAGLVPLDHVHKTQISAAMGGYKNNQALAVGAFHYLNDRTLLNAGAAYGGNDSVSYKVGVTFGF